MQHFLGDASNIISDPSSQSVQIRYMCCIYPVLYITPKKKVKGVMSGDRGGQGVGTIAPNPSVRKCVIQQLSDD